jgi:pimeloyl-ACP methyl ester carboxylesterase
MKKTTRGLILLLVLAIAGCATPVGVTRVTPEQATRARTQNVLTNGKPSPASAQFLYRLDLVERAKTDPEGTLKVLHAGLGHADESARLMALAELSYIYATQSGNRSYDLAAAAYAWAFLFPKDPAKRPGGYDPQAALALGIYDRAIADGLTEGEGTTEVVDLSARSVDLPFGSLELSRDAAGFYYGKSQLTDFVSLADYKVRGLRNRYRQPGIGAALVAQASRTGDDRADQWLPRRGKVPVTLVLRFADPRQGMADGTVGATIEVHDALTDPDIEIDGHSVPLETDNTVALAYALEDSPLWDFEFAGFRSGDLGSAFQTKTAHGKAGGALFMLRPYTAGRIPIVFVHGTASSPARWAEMFNEIMGDHELARRYQCWFFMYNTGNPIPYSALRLREALTAAIQDIDPEGDDAALRDMVVIGHSQGGLLTKMLVVDSGNKFWDNISKVPFDQADLPPDTRDLLRRALFVKPLPFVKRVIFIATPHRGSFLANNWLGSLGRRLISLPGNLATMGSDLMTLHGKDPLFTHLPTSLDNMKASNPFLKTLNSMPIAPGVYVNSIIPMKGDGPPADANDGVVAYQSAHIEPVESEFVVKNSSHSTQGTPPTIEEVRRILYLNLEGP